MTRTPRAIDALQALARDLVGDGGAPNLYVVTICGVVVTATRDFARAYHEWHALSQQRPRVECALEDRRYGTLACVERDADAPCGWAIIDDTHGRGWAVLDETQREEVS